MEAKEVLTVEQVEWFDDRFYKIQTEGLEEMFLPSVTTILGIINKPFLSRWRGDIGNEAADQRMNYASWRGSRIHDAIHKGLQLNKAGKREPIQMMKDEKVKAYEQDEWIQILRFKEFQDTLDPEIKFSELIVYALLGGYAGTADLLCNLKAGDYEFGKRGKVSIPTDGLYVGDIKTGKSLDEEYHFQTAAYAHAVECMDMGKVVGTFVLHLNTESAAGWKMAVRNDQEMETDYNLFVNALQLWKFKNPNHTPKVFTMPTTIQL